MGLYNKKEVIRQPHIFLKDINMSNEKLAFDTILVAIFSFLGASIGSIVSAILALAVAELRT